MISLHYLIHHSPPVENQTHTHVGRVSFDMKRKALVCTGTARPTVRTMKCLQTGWEIATAEAPGSLAHHLCLIPRYSQTSL